MPAEAMYGPRSSFSTKLFSTWKCNFSVFFSKQIEYHPRIKNGAPMSYLKQFLCNAY
jgi:hypothetical protein